MQTSFLELKIIFLYKIVNMSVSAYTFNDSNKTFCSIRMNAVEIRPLPVLDENNNIIPTMTRRTKEADYLVDWVFKKLKYAIHKYVSENTKNERIVVQ